MTRRLACLAVLCLVSPIALAADPLPAPREKAAPAQPPAVVPKITMPLTGLTAAKPMFEACVYRYGVGTTNTQCQAFVSQGLGMYYSYVWIEAARAFETALIHDPECAYAWLMLSRSLEKWGRNGPVISASPFQATVGGAVFAKLPDRVGKSATDYALEMARKLMPRASHREQLLIQSRLQEKGMWPDTPADARTKKAQQSLDELLTLYEDDEEGWFWRAQLADGPNGKTPFYKALLRINPIHPGANHELVHFYEAIRRPALGWPFAEGYIKSSPGIPHAFHMQAHLATRIGKWGPTTDWSSQAVEMEKQYHTYQGVTPGEDHQFNHHMETLARSLVHDGRFYEARRLKTEADVYKYNFRPEWFRLALSTAEWDDAQAIVDHFRRANKADGAYYAALLYLEKGDKARAGAEVETLRQLQQTRRADKRAELRLWEVQGRYLCQTGNGEAGLKMLKKAVDATKADYNHHAWGNGAVLMEAWGIAALEAGNAEQAEEAFQEALAHDTGSVRGALGMWALCRQVGRTEEASRYLAVARRCWSRSDPDDFDWIKDNLSAKATRLLNNDAGAVAK
jgi:tetratricopeptide (TPR) repeat protein